MNEDLNLVEILKDCPEGTKLYSTVLGEVELCTVEYNNTYPICVKDNIGNTWWLTSNGKFIKTFGGECILFPSKDQRDWSKFKPNQPKFDPKTLQPFDKVIVKNSGFPWRCDIFSYYQRNKRITCHCISDDYIYDRCIPYNEDTKHLVGTTEEAPEFYRYWE